ncbi:universal stress protein [Methanothrix sp.]|jgi:nucleotide-binding universal stress UspA family protein|uniref:universal stress protein n=1 Tax=Methanothrix sp. TaxID=90426 RepID=UPI001BD1F663
MFEKILAATDGSEHGLRAAKVAVELAKLSGGRVYAIYVADTQRTAHLPDDMLLFSIKELLLKEGKEAIDQVKQIADKKGVDFKGEVVEGNPSDEIIRYAKKGDMNMIVVGAVGRTGLDKFLLGSVAEKVVRNSKIPVLTVPREES